MTVERLERAAFKNGLEQGVAEGIVTGVQQKAVEAALMLINEYNEEPEIAAQKMNAPLELVLEGLEQDK